MKKLLLVLVCVVLATFLFVGCLPEWIAPGDDEEEEIPVLTMEANVDAVLVVPEPEDPYQVAWSIENVGELFIREYIITFDVLYPMIEKDNVIFTVLGNYLEVGDKKEGILDLVAYDTPDTVSVSWELFD
jgi:hypothetical protein